MKVAADGAYENLVTGAGTVADPIRAMAQRSDVSEMAKSTIDRLVTREWGCRLHVAELPDEATRKGFELTRAELEDDSGEDHEDSEEEAAKQVQDLLEEVRAVDALREGTTWARQYGGAILIAHVDDGRSAEEPIDLSAPDFRLVRLEVRSRHEVEMPMTMDLEDDPKSPRYGQPRMWRLQPIAGASQPAPIHASRVFCWQGWQPFTSPEGWSWGQSVLEGFEPSWKAYSHCLNETVATVPRLGETRLGIPGLADALKSADATIKAGFRRYLGEVAAVRSALRFFVHDDAETVADAKVDITGAVSLLERLREDVAGAAGVSIQKFFRLQQEGLSNNDETGAQRDDASVAAFQERHLRPALNWLTEIAAAHLGLRLESWMWVPKALREETPTQRATRQNTEAQRDRAYIDAGVAAVNEVRAGAKQRDLPYEWSDDYDEPVGGPPEVPETPEEPGPRDAPKDPADEPEDLAA